MVLIIFIEFTGPTFEVGIVLWAFLDSINCRNDFWFFFFPPKFRVLCFIRDTAEYKSADVVDLSYGTREYVLFKRAGRNVSTPPSGLQIFLVSVHLGCLTKTDGKK